MTTSPLARTLKRLLLQQNSTFAMARALKAGALLLPLGAARAKVARWGQRTEACAVTSRFFLVRGPEGTDHLVRSMKRADHARWCPLCEAKRANEALSDLIDLTDHVLTIAPRARPLMLTLTSKNRRIGATGADIYQPSRDMLLGHQKALKTFFGYKRIQAALLGHVTSIEFVCGTTDGQLMAHWHSHSLVLAAPGALSDERYIRQAEYVALWKRALGVSYNPVVDIRAVKCRNGSTAADAALRSAIREVIKYAFDSSLFEHGDHGISADPRAVLAFAIASYRRRLVSMDRIFLDAKRVRRAARKNSGPPPDPPSGR